MKDTPIRECAMLLGGNTDSEKLNWLIEHAPKVEADLTRQLAEANKKMPESTDSGKSLFPIEVHGWKIEPEGEPWALKYNFGPLRASNDGEVINGTLEEILTAIVGQTEDYFYKAIDGYKKSEAELKRSANEREGICKLSESKLLDQLAEAKEANERLSKAVDGFDRNTVRLSSELSRVKDLMNRMAEVLKYYNDPENNDLLTSYNSLKHSQMSYPSAGTRVKIYWKEVINDFDRGYLYQTPTMDQDDFMVHIPNPINPGGMDSAPPVWIKLSKLQKNDQVKRIKYLTH